MEEEATTDNEDVPVTPNEKDNADGTREEGKDEEEEEESINDDDNDTGMADEFKPIFVPLEPEEKKQK